MQLLILLSILGLIFSNLDDSNDDDSTDEEEEEEHEIAGDGFNQYGEILDSHEGSGFNRYGEID